MSRIKNPTDINRSMNFHYYQFSSSNKLIFYSTFPTGLLILCYLPSYSPFPLSACKYFFHLSAFSLFLPSSFPYFASQFISHLPQLPSLHKSNDFKFSSLNTMLLLLTASSVLLTLNFQITSRRWLYTLSHSIPHHSVVSQGEGRE